MLGIPLRVGQCNSPITIPLAEKMQLVQLSVFHGRHKSMLRRCEAQVSLLHSRRPVAEREHFILPNMTDPEGLQSADLSNLCVCNEHPPFAGIGLGADHSADMPPIFRRFSAERLVVPLADLRDGGVQQVAKNLSMQLSPMEAHFLLVVVQEIWETF